MRFILASLTLILSTTAFAQQDNCQKYATKDRYMTAIKTVAAHVEYSIDELCTLPKVLDIEAQPSRVITPKGDVIPHVRVQLHMAYESCLYMVRDADQVITSSRCYSGW
ncbi:hypothetical protein [Bdellovibrio bacteriovorus]|uniref:hypothetical protein n=1 Tax=Bdellovibrio bacteriovorus TaxID=959 RepID=UPI0035A718B3